MKTPFKKTYYDKTEFKYLKDAMLNGTDYLDKVKEKLSGIYECKNVYMTCNGSSAFDLLFYALDFKAGSEVIMPSFTYPSVANTVLRMGLVSVFCDIDSTTLVMDLEDVKRKITEKTCCIVPTHYGGASVDMDRLKDIAGDIFILEDAALSFGAKYKDKSLGAMGDAGILSFHKTKNISSDEGGALIVKDYSLSRRLDIIYENGTDRRAFIRGKIDYYSWQKAGMNLAMNNLSAAILSSQIEKAENILIRQRTIYERYEKGLSEPAMKYGFGLPNVPKSNKNNYHVFYIMLKDNSQREHVRLYLAEQGIGAYIHYVPLHMSKMGHDLGYEDDDFPATKDVSERILRLPIYASMNIEDALCR